MVANRQTVVVRGVGLIQRERVPATDRGHRVRIIIIIVIIPLVLVMVCVITYIYGKEKKQVMM